MSWQRFIIGKSKNWRFIQIKGENYGAAVKLTLIKNREKH